MSRVDEALAKDWFYEFDFPDGRTTTPNVPSDTATIHSARLAMLLGVLEQTFDGDLTQLSALDLACHEAWFASHLARRGLKDVLAVDVRPEHPEDAAVIREIHGLDQRPWSCTT